MMLQRLYELAKREGLIDDPNFSKEYVHFSIRIDAAGHAIGSVSKLDEQERPSRELAPSPPERSGRAIRPGYLFDKAEYILGVPKPEADPEQVEQTEKCAKAFADFAASIALRTRDPAAIAVSLFVKRRTEEQKDIFSRHPGFKWTGSENIAFIFDPDGQAPVFEREALRRDLAQQRNAEQAEGGIPARCLVTGERSFALKLHREVKVFGGVKVVCFDKPSFESQGLEQGANAPVSPAAAAGYVAALNWLVERIGKRFRQGVAIGSDAVTVYWTREKNDAEDHLSWFFDPTPEQVQKLFESPLKGLEPSAADETKFYAVTLSGNASRLVVRDWLETTVREVKQNVRQWFADLELGREERSLPIKLLLESLEGPGGRGLSPNLGGRLFGAALRGRFIPREVLSVALRRLRMRTKKSDKRSKNRSDDRTLVHARVALIKATVQRLSPERRITVSLDETNQGKPYLLGRMFAAFEHLQYATQGDINASIRDRFFAAASTTPGAVFPQLQRLSNHHLKKLKREHPGRAVNLDKLITSIYSGIQSFPATLPLEEQGMFAIGYFHQREKLFAKSDAPEQPLAANAA